jgi:hypothetical protein
MAWQLVPAAVTLREQIDKRWPNRDKGSDGSIGDAVHAARPSDHNPDADGWVHAIDVDKDGIDAQALADQLVALARAGKDGGRLKNIVWNDRVASGTYPDTFWTWRGSGYGHRDHIHISFTSAAQRDSSPFPVPVLTDRRRVRVTRFPSTGAYSGKSEHTIRVGTKRFLSSVEYVAVERDGLGRNWLRTPAGNYVLAAATAYKP